MHIHILGICGTFMGGIAQLALACGADDLDGTVEEEKIIHAAGADTGQKMTTVQLEQIIRSAGYVPVQRDSLYNEITI